MLRNIQQEKFTKHDNCDTITTEVITGSPFRHGLETTQSNIDDGPARASGITCEKGRQSLSCKAIEIIASYSLVANN
jgi:hypothetical protein